MNSKDRRRHPAGGADSDNSQLLARLWHGVCPMQKELEPSFEHNGFRSLPSHTLSPVNPRRACATAFLPLILLLTFRATRLSVLASMVSGYMNPAELLAACICDKAASSASTFRVAM